MDRTTLSYFSNFDNTSFDKEKPREFNRLRDDPCDIKQRNYSNEKTLKFTTTTFRDLHDSNRVKNHFAIGIDDQLFVPTKYIDTYSNLLNGNSGNIMTNCNNRSELGELPLPTMPSRYQLFHGNVDIEDKMRNMIDINKTSSNPRDTMYYNRSFYLFNECVDKPNPLDSVEEKIRCGVSTRYPNGIKQGKNFRYTNNIENVEPSRQ